MAILLYCVADAAVRINIPKEGVGDQAVQTKERGNLRCFWSASTDVVPGEGGAQSAALAFHRVLQEIFRDTAIIPFRFPTLVEHEAALTSFLDEHAEEYRESLQRLRDVVQMEIRISVKDAQSNLNNEQSGTEYLRAKQSWQRRLRQTAAALRQPVESSVKGWRERDSAQGARIFALVARSQVRDFEAALAAVEVGPEMLVRVSGPWPATEFLKRDDV